MRQAVICYQKEADDGRKTKSASKLKVPQTPVRDEKKPDLRSFKPQWFSQRSWLHYDEVRLIDWLIDWLVDWLIDWLTDWLIAWFIYSFKQEGFQKALFCIFYREGFP